MKLGNIEIEKAYIGGDEVTKMYLGSFEVFAASSGSPVPPEPPQSGITFLPNGVRSSNAPSWTLGEYVDTGIYVTGEPEVRVKYIGGGIFSDRIVGFDAIECGSDDEDFRFFPTMCDAGEVRLESISETYYDEGVPRDITFGNIYAYDNLLETMIDSTTPSGNINSATTIRVDMSTNWIQEVEIMIDGTIVWHGLAAFDGTDYGMYDTVSQTMFPISYVEIIDEGA